MNLRMQTRISSQLLVPRFLSVDIHRAAVERWSDLVRVRAMPNVACCSCRRVPSPEAQKELWRGSPVTFRSMGGRRALCYLKTAPLPAGWKPQGVLA
jgi:hypothetical protein